MVGVAGLELEDYFDGVASARVVIPRYLNGLVGTSPPSTTWPRGLRGHRKWSQMCYIRLSFKVARLVLNTETLSWKMLSEIAFGWLHESGVMVKINQSKDTRRK